MSSGSHNPFKTIKSKQQMMVQDEEDMEGIEMAPSETSDDQQHIIRASGSMYPPKQIVPQLHQPSSGGSTAR